MSQDWQGLPFNLLNPFIVLLFPGSHADSMVEESEVALSRRICSICGRNGPPRTTWKD